MLDHHLALVARRAEVEEDEHCVDTVAFHPFERRTHFRGGADRKCLNLQAEPFSRRDEVLLAALQARFHAFGPGGVVKQPDALGARQHVPHELDSLGVELGIPGGGAGDIASGPVERSHQANLDRIIGMNHDDRHRGGRALGGEGFLPADRHDDCHGAAQVFLDCLVQFRRITVQVSPGVTNVFPFAPAQLAHAGVEARVGRQLAKYGLRAHCDDPDRWRFGGHDKRRSGCEEKCWNRFHCETHAIGADKLNVPCHRLCTSRPPSSAT